MFCGKAATKTSCCYELMKFLLLIKSRRISSSMKTYFTEVQNDAVVLLLPFFGNVGPHDLLLICSFDRHLFIKGFLEPSNALDADVLVDTKI